MGHDGIHHRILREAHKELAEPLNMIFHSSIEEGNLPEDWKTANITAIFKKGSKNEPGNYRPVSLTSIVCKIMEKNRERAYS